MNIRAFTTRLKIPRFETNSLLLSPGLEMFFFAWLLEGKIENEQHSNKNKYQGVLD